MKTCLTCGSDPAPKNNYCYKCIKRKYRKNNPIKSSYQNLRSSAKRRGISFLLTLDQFKSFCIKTEYIINKGINKDSFHIDRIIESEGYHEKNIQVLTNSENVKKWIEWSGRTPEGINQFTTKRSFTNNNSKENDVPF